MNEITIKIEGLDALVASIQELARTMSGQASNTNQAAPVISQMTPAGVQAPVMTTPMQSVVPVNAGVMNAPVTAVQGTAGAQVPTAQTMIPTTAVAQEYSQDQLAVAAAGLVNMGKQPQLIAILNSMGVNALTELNPAQYPQFAQALRAEGAVI